MKNFFAVSMISLVLTAGFTSCSDDDDSSSDDLIEMVDVVDNADGTTTTTTTNYSIIEVVTDTNGDLVSETANFVGEGGLTTIVTIPNEDGGTTLT